MASFTAIAAVSRTLQTLLLDRMSTAVTVTLAPPDITVSGVGGARVNLYLMQVIENAALKNQEIPGKGYPAAYGHPPLSLDLRFLMTTYSGTEDQPTADLNAQTILGDAMRVFNDFGNRVDQLKITNPAAGLVGDPVLDPDLAGEFERIKLVLHPTTLDDITKVWSAVSGTNFRRSVVYEVTVVQIETPAPRVSPKPVESRRINMTLRKRPEILDSYLTPIPPANIIGERRVHIGDEITIVSQGAVADKLFVRLGILDPIRLSPTGDGQYKIVIPDTLYPVDLDHAVTRPIPVKQQLPAGPFEVQILSQYQIEAVEGGLGKGKTLHPTRVFASNVALLQICPRVLGATPSPGNAATILRVTGDRLWHPAAKEAVVIIGDIAIPVRHSSSDPWAAPTATKVEVPIKAADGLIDISPLPYIVAVQVDGARSLETGVTFQMGP
jgi:hypothetical protein